MSCRNVSSHNIVQFDGMGGMCEQLLQLILWNGQVLLLLVSAVC